MGLILTRWRDDEGHFHSARLPKENVRRLTASEWDIIEHHLKPARTAFHPLGHTPAGIYSGLTYALSMAMPPHDFRFGGQLESYSCRYRIDHRRGDHLLFRARGLYVGTGYISSSYGLTDSYT